MLCPLRPARARRRAALLLLLLGCCIALLLLLVASLRLRHGPGHGADDNSARAGTDDATAAATAAAAAADAADGGDDDDAGAPATTCEPIAVAMVAVGVRSARLLPTVLKSLLFHRRRPVLLHLLVDGASEPVLERLLATWRVPQLRVRFRRVDALLPLVSRVPTWHYSGTAGLLKLVMDVALGDGATRVIALDTDVLVGADIARLWAHFDRFNARQLLGLVPQQSEWYLGTLKAALPWPALGRGFNTGVMLMRLDRMREAGWQSLWPGAVADVLRTRPAEHQFTHLADQDVINALIRARPEIVYVLPCQWNIQLGDNSDADQCIGPAGRADGAAGIVHWNSPRKWDVRAPPHAATFRAIRQLYDELDGTLLRHELLACPSPAAPAPVPAQHAAPDDDACGDLRAAARLTYRTHVYYVGDPTAPAATHGPACAVAMVAQMSMDRIGNLEALCDHWTGPISIAVYGSDAEAARLSAFVAASETLRARSTAGPDAALMLHMVYREGAHFPINYLRNVALQAVPSAAPYVLLGDIDLLPSYGSHAYLCALAAQLPDDAPGRAHRQPWALVVPAFETHRYSFKFPSDKRALLLAWDRGDVVQFRLQEWPTGHRATDYERFRSAHQPYEIDPQPADIYEPYVAVRRADVHLYDTRFVGFGWNKVSHIYEMIARGYSFLVAPDAFLIHMPHSPSAEIARFRRDARYRNCMALLKREFVEEVGRRVGNVTGTVLIPSKA